MAIAPENVAIGQFGLWPRFQPWPKTHNYIPGPMAAFIKGGYRGHTLVKAFT